MAEEQAAAESKEAGSSLLRKLGLYVGVVLTAMIVAIALYHFMIAPKLSGEKPPEPKIPVGTVTVPFEEMLVSTRKPADPSVPASLLKFKVSLLCSNQETADLINNNLDWFIDCLRELHSGHPRDQVDDEMLKESIRKQVEIRANEILDSLQEVPNKENRVIKVFHLDFTPIDTM